jgi:DNA-binding MarR family transcriptional regulator
MNLADEHPALTAVLYIRDHVRRDPMAAAVGMAIAANVDDYGVAAVGIRALAEQSGLNPDTVSKAVKRLEAGGHLAIEHGRGNTYRISTAVAGPRGQAERSRGEAERSRGQAEHPSAVARHGDVFGEAERSRGEAERSRGQAERSRGEAARSAPGGGGTYTRDVERTATSTTVAAVAGAGLRPHALEALQLYTEEEVERNRPRNRFAYANRIKHTRSDVLLSAQERYTSAAELLDVLRFGVPSTTTERPGSPGDPVPPMTPEQLHVRDVLAAAYARPVSHDLPLEEPEPIVRDLKLATAAFARGLAGDVDGVA